MHSQEIVRRAIEFDNLPRLPFWEHWNHKMPGFPDDVCDIWEMDRQQAGWLFETPGADDWGCLWSTTDQKKRSKREFGERTTTIADLPILTATRRNQMPALTGCRTKDDPALKTRTFHLHLQVPKEQIA